MAGACQLASRTDVRWKIKRHWDLGAISGSFWLTEIQLRRMVTKRNVSRLVIGCSYVSRYLVVTWYVSGRARARLPSRCLVFDWFTSSTHLDIQTHPDKQAPGNYFGEIFVYCIYHVVLLVSNTHTFRVDNTILIYTLFWNITVLRHKLECWSISPCNWLSLDVLLIAPDFALSKAIWRHLVQLHQGHINSILCSSIRLCPSQ
jgi:hypothetical protein